MSQTNLSIGAKRKLLQAATYSIAITHPKGVIPFYQVKYSCSAYSAQLHVNMSLQTIKDFQEVGFTLDDILIIAKLQGFI